MRKRNSNPNTSCGSINDNSNSNSSDEEEEREPQTANPQETNALHLQSPERRDNDKQRANQHLVSHFDIFRSYAYNSLHHLKQGKAWWVQILTIYIAASLTYSYSHVGNNSTNVQIAIMTVITLMGATPFASTHLIAASIGAFVGGQNIIGSTGAIEDTIHTIPAMNYVWLLLLSYTVGLVWYFIINSKLKILDGYAGRLGTTTFIGMNLAMITIYGPLGIVDWDRYYYGFVHTIHIGEEDSSLSLASAWKWTEEASLAVGYVVSVVWLGVIAGGTRILHNNHVQRCNNKDNEISSSTPVTPLNNVLVPVLWALFSILVINATRYKHAPALFNGFAVGAYVAMASLQKISTVSKFALVSLLASVWGLALTPFFVGFAGKSGLTSMLGHVTHSGLEAAYHRLQKIRKRRQVELRRQLEQLQVELQEQQQAMQPISQKDSDEQQQQEEAPTSPHHNHHHKPKKETFYTKQQRRQQKRLKHLQEEEKSQMKEQDMANMQDPPKLHHRAWNVLPVDATHGDGMWQHSLGSPQDFNDVV